MEPLSPTSGGVCGAVLLIARPADGKVVREWFLRRYYRNYCNNRRRVACKIRAAVRAVQSASHRPVATSCRNYYPRVKGMLEQSNQDEILRSYIERVVALQNERHHALDINDLKGIAREIGMSEEDILAADRAVEMHVERGLRHGVHGQWAAAIAELAAAVALNPAHLRALYGLAVAYKERWMSDGHEEDRRQAMQHARQCLQLYPGHDPAHLLLNDLDPRRAGANNPVGKDTRPRWVLMILLVLGIAALFWLFLRPDLPAGDILPPDSPADLRPPSASPTADPVSGTGAVPDVNDESGNGLGLLGQEIPIVWLGQKMEGVGLELREVHSEVGSTRKLQLLIDNTGDVPLNALEVAIDDYDMYGLQISTKKLTLLSEEDSPIAPKAFRITYLEYPVSGLPATYKVSILDAH